MAGRPKKKPREKDLTSRYNSGQLDQELDEDRIARSQQFTHRNATAQQDKINKTIHMREVNVQHAADADLLPTGEIIQVHSLFCEVLSDNVAYLCVTRKTASTQRTTDMVVGDIVRFSITGVTHEKGKPEGVVEKVLPRKTVLTRSDSFKGQIEHPIVANAQQMLIVASIAEPNLKWGLVDRMIIAAMAGGVDPILCINKIDLASSTKKARESYEFVLPALDHYKTIGVQCVLTSVTLNQGIEDLRAMLKDKTTVLAGHSGVGKSSLINCIDSDLDLRIGDISGYTGKGRHTTTSARRYPMKAGGCVIDTPGVKLFGLWGVTVDNINDFFPDIKDNTAPDWRKESYERIKGSLKPVIPANWMND